MVHTCQNRAFLGVRELGKKRSTSGVKRFTFLVPRPLKSILATCLGVSLENLRGF